MVNTVAVDQRARLAEALEPVLAPHAALHLRDGLQSHRRNPGVALHADAILTFVHPVERRQQTVHALQQDLASCEDGKRYRVFTNAKGRVVVEQQ
jgi:hypothetical protein